jgi:predicted  nucleic acid-binding Zn-ribbon protein
MLLALSDETQARIDRAKEEATYERDEGPRYLRDFKTLKDVYNQKISQLEALSKELRKKQKDIRDNSNLHAAQRAKFLDLKKLLVAKLNHYKSGQSSGTGGEGKQGDDVFSLGASNVLKIAQ